MTDNNKLPNSSAFDSLFTSTTGTDQPSTSSTASTQASFAFAQDWAAYHAHRPEYPAKLYDMLFAYHEAHSSQKRSSDAQKPAEPPVPDLSSFNRALDLGTGGGVVATNLLSRFSHVVALDPSSHHISSAGKLLRIVVEQQARKKDEGAYAADAQPLARFEDRVTLVTGYGEDLLSHVEAQSLDMVIVAEAIHWMDSQKVISATAEALKPGGTFAVWWYSPCMRIAGDSEAVGTTVAGDSANFNRTSGHGKAMSALSNLFGVWRRFVAPSVGRGNLSRATAMCNAGLRSLEFDDTQWETGVQRHEWIRPDEWKTIGGFELTPDESKVKETDLLLEHLIESKAGNKEGESIMRKEAADLGWIRGYMHNLWQDANFNDHQDSKAVYSDLGAALDDLGGKVTLTWPLVLILATKK